MQEFDVFGPKDIACINGVEGPLATRCVGVQMIRSAPDSPRPRRRVDRDPSRWQRLRDMLHECLLGELGREAPKLAERPDLCPLGGRAGAIGQPLLALATLADPEGTWGLHRVVAAHATEQAEAAKDDHFPEEDYVVLSVLTQKVLKGGNDAPPLTSKDILQGCTNRQQALFQRWSPRKVSAVPSRYGIVTKRTGKGRIYCVPIEKLKTLETNYEIDLNTEGRDPLLFIPRY